VQALQPLADTKRIELTHVRPNPALIVNGDHRRLRRAFFNLLERAISVSAPGSAVIVAWQLTSEAVTVQVVDRGEGMSPEDRARVFEKHSQLDSSEESRWGSTGVGLHAIKLILEAHDGRVEVKSHSGVGSTFYLTLPRPGSDTPPLPSP
jgi:signal transduction histidine kinase